MGCFLWVISTEEVEPWQCMRSPRGRCVRGGWPARMQPWGPQILLRRWQVCKVPWAQTVGREPGASSMEGGIMSPSNFSL